MGIFEENQKKIESILNSGIGILARNYTVKKLDAGKFSQPVTMNMKFNIAHYEIEGVGHLMTMTTEGNPQMQMVTYTLMPYFKALPMISSDFIFSDQAGMVLIEAYELVEDRENPDFRSWIEKHAENFRSLAEMQVCPTQSSFCDAIRPVFVSKVRAPQYDEASLEALVHTVELFIQQEKSLPLLNDAQKEAQAKIQHQYVNDLIDLNGFSTQAWVKDHGADYVREFYHDIFFGV